MPTQPKTGISWADDESENDTDTEVTEHPKPPPIETTPEPIEPLDTETVDEAPENTYRPPFKVNVYNILHELTDQEVGDYFYYAGCNVKEVLLFRHENGNSKGRCVIEFSESKDIKIALDQNGKNFRGRALRIRVCDESNRGQSNLSGNRQGKRRESGFNEFSRQRNLRSGHESFERTNKFRGRKIQNQSEFHHKGRETPNSSRKKDEESQKSSTTDSFKLMSPSVSLKEEQKEKDDVQISERPKLNLLPRSTTIPMQKENGGTSRPTSIFGVGKPREEKLEEVVKKAETTAEINGSTEMLNKMSLKEESIKKIVLKKEVPVNESKAKEIDQEKNSIQSPKFKDNKKFNSKENLADGSKPRKTSGIKKKILTDDKRQDAQKGNLPKSVNISSSKGDKVLEQKEDEGLKKGKRDKKKDKTKASVSNKKKSKPKVKVDDVYARLGIDDSE
mmetsp:Transcript_9905/g.13914  ORF Transcript_9905/g.13914 Transcript_9905/m.13914 type:complete len:448 (-) Transcript_9905:66-1409(-)